METAILTAETVDVSERSNVPDVRCPGCGAEIKLDARTYAFYDGPIRCHPCQALFRIRTGDFDLAYQTSGASLWPTPRSPGPRAEC